MQIPLNIYIWPDPILRKRSIEIPIDGIPDRQEVINGLVQIMRAHHGAGLAAPQTGMHERIFLVENMEKDKDPLVFINPKILEQSKENQLIIEGCLSIPGLQVPVERSKHVKISYYDTSANYRNEEFSDQYAHVIQHEIEHLDGRIFIEHLPPIKRDIILRKMKRLKKYVKRHIDASAKEKKSK